jgi:hypothetical protein
VIARAVREFRDTRLIERDPGGDPHFLANVLAEIAQRHCVHHGSPHLAVRGDDRTYGRDTPERSS